MLSLWRVALSFRSVNCLKGLVTRWIFYFLNMRKMVINFFNHSCEREKIIEKYRRASLKTFTNSKVCSKGRIKISVLAFLRCYWSIFFQCTCHSRLSKHFSESQVAFRTTFRVQPATWKPAQAFWKKELFEGFSELVSNFIEASMKTFF